MTPEDPSIDINGMAHVILTVSQFDKARAFYSRLLPAFRMTRVHDGPDFCYHVGARTAIGVRKCDPEFEGERFEQYRVGLHHLCLRARSREDVDKTARLVAELGGTIVRSPEERDWARATITCFLRTRTASASRSITSRARGCWHRAKTLGRAMTTCASKERTWSSGIRRFPRGLLCMS